jgi:hypothetical protein
MDWRRCLPRSGTVSAAITRERTEQREKFSGMRRVEVAGRFVGQQDFGLVHQGAG